MCRRLFAIVLMLAVPLIGVVAAAPVSAQTTPTIAVTSATLVAKGAAVDVGLAVTCEPGDGGTAYVSVTQRSGNTITQGSGAENINACTGQSQIVTVRALLYSGSAPFKKGDGAVDATFQQCTQQGVCQDANVKGTVRIK